jgi:ribose transport system permease protein
MATEPTATGSGHAGKQMTNNTLRQIRSRFSVAREFASLVILAALVIALAVTVPNFFTPLNLWDVARLVAIVSLIAAGETLVILTANIDLSVGAVLGLSAAVGAGVLRATDNALLGVAAALAIGAFAGSINGFLVARLKLASFIITLAVAGICTGAILLYTNASPIAITNARYVFLGEGDIAGVPFPIPLAAGVYVALWVLLNRTKFGRYVYAIGGNETATRLAGVPVERYKFLVFLLAGALAGLAGVVLSARLSASTPTLGVGNELLAITAVVLGGTSLFGGEGKIWGTLIGAAILQLISNSLNLLDVTAYYQSVVTGVVIVLAVAADRLLRAKTNH